MRSILITGGAGSLGTALVTILNDLPGVERILVYSRDEWKHAQMAEKFPPYHKVRYTLGDVRDRDRLAQVMGGVDTVIHAAALKRVDSVAYNPGEVVRTNVEGTMNVIDAAAGIAERVLVISTDKAVQPTNIYGSSKMMAEHIAVYANSYAYPKGTRVAVARYGNVLGSRGSMVHLFRDCIINRKPIPVTDVRCTRFLITLKNAAYFVLSSLKIMEGGEIFVPKLKSVRITDFVAAMTEEDFEIVGMRPGGEKLHETLISSEEAPRTYCMSDLRYAVHPHLTPWVIRVRPAFNFAREDFNSRENEFYTMADLKRILAEEGYLDAS